MSASLVASLSADGGVPELSTAKMLAHPANERLKSMLEGDPPAKSLQGKRIAVLTTDGVEEIELTAVLTYFKRCGADVELVAPPMPELPDSLGVHMPAIRKDHIFTIRYMGVGGWLPIDKFISDVDAANYDAVVIPGGAWNPDALRADANALELVKAMAAANKVVAAICHGPWVLCDADLLDGKKVACWWSMRRDVERCGATFVDEAVAVEGKMITSRYPGDLPDFMDAVVDSLVN